MGNAVESIYFQRKVLASTVMDPLSARIKGDATLERVKVRFYSGQVGLLHIILKLKRRNGSEIDLVTYAGTDKFLAGDDDILDIPVSMPVYNDEEIIVYAQNLAVEDPGEEGTKTYTVNIVAEVDYYAGTGRVAGGVFRG